MIFAQDMREAVPCGAGMVGIIHKLSHKEVRERTGSSEREAATPFA